MRTAGQARPLPPRPKPWEGRNCSSTRWRFGGLPWVRPAGQVRQRNKPREGRQGVAQVAGALRAFPGLGARSGNLPHALD
jgi:hypothetical protein